jgi:hypothetical protein
MCRALVAAASVLAVALAGCSSTASPASLSRATTDPTASPWLTASPAPTPRSHAVTGAATVTPPSIAAENLHPGTSDWRMGGVGYQVGTDIGAEIKGYASDASVDLGQQITLFVSVSPAQQLKIDIYRLGWYGGTGGRLMVGGTWLPGITQDACPIEAGLRTCDWQPTIRFTVPSSWVSGVYLAILTNERHFQNAIHFVVRDDASTSPLLYVQPVTTYQAYNPWPRDGSGRSLYAATRVSFDRPYADDGIARSFFDFEQPFVAWLERAGYEVTYATSIDLHQQGAALLRRHRVMVTAGHDEYWTAEMRVAATSALASGTSLAFFSANNMYWQARLEAAPDGEADRVLVCYRTEALDPEPSPVLKTVRWRDAPVSLPELNLLGAEYTNMVAGRAPWVVAGDDSWVYQGTGLSDGQSIADLVWGESDRPQSPTPASAPTASILSDSPFVTRYGQTDRSQAVLYQAPSGAWVFNASTFGWTGAINPFGQPDPRVERMTANLLDRMSEPQ